MKKRRKPIRGTCFDAIQRLMTDYQPRTSEMIADVTGFSHGRVRSEIAANFSFATEKRIVAGGGKVTWYRLRRHKLTPIESLVDSGT